MNTITKTYNNISRSLGRFFDIKTLLRDWLFSSNYLEDMIHDEVHTQTADSISKVDDWVYEVESLEDKVNDFEYKMDDWEYETLNTIENEARDTVAQAKTDILALINSQCNVQLIITKKENDNV